MKKYKSLSLFICTCCFAIYSNQFTTAADYFNYQKESIATLPESPNPGYVNTFACTPDGTKLLTGASDGTIMLWDIESGEVIRTFKIAPFTPEYHNFYPVSSISFSPDGKKFIAAYKGYSGSYTSNSNLYEGNLARIWDMNTGQIVATIEGHKEFVNAAVFSPDGAIFATCSGTSATNSKDRTAKVWDATTGKEIISLEGHASGVNSLAFSSDSTKLITGGYDHSAILWDIRSGQQILKCTDPNCEILNVALSPDNKKIITLGKGKSPFIMWDAVTGKTLTVLDSAASDSFFHSVFFSSTGKILAFSGISNALKLWDIENKQKIHTYKISPYYALSTHVTFSNDESEVFAATANAIVIWNADSEKNVKTLGGHSSRILSLAYSPDGLYAVSGSSDSTVIIWDMKTHKEVRRLTGHSEEINSISLSPDGNKIASSSYDNTVKIWDFKSGQELLTIQGYKSFIVSLAFSKDGSKLLSGTENGTAILWNAVTGAQIASFRQHSQPIQYIAFSADEKNILSGSRDKFAKLWDANTGQIIYKLTNCNTVSFSPDKTEIFTTSDPKTVKVWNSINGELLRKFTFGSSNMDMGSDPPAHISNQVIFSPNGKMMYIGRYNILLNPQTGNYLGYLFLPYVNLIDSAIFSPDNSTLLCGTEEFIDGPNAVLQIFDMRLAKSSKQYTINTEKIYSAAVLSDGIRLLCGEIQDETIQFTLRNITTDKIISQFTAPKEPLEYTRLSPDGSLVAVAYFKGIGTAVFDAATGQKLYRLNSAIDDDHVSLKFSGNGEKFITIDTGTNSATVWNSHTGKSISSLSAGHTYFISIDLSQDGSLAVTGGNDDKITIWDVNTKKVLNTFSENRDIISHVFISPDNNKIISFDGHFNTLWDCSSGDKNHPPHHIMYNFSYYTDIHYIKIPTASSLNIKMVPFPQLFYLILKMIEKFDLFKANFLHSQMMIKP